MYSKAKIAGHPIHPMLVGFPIALYAATAVSLIAYGGTGNPFWYHVAFVANVAALVMALVAVIPGVIDFLALPNRSRAQQTAILHLAFNSFTVALFLVSAIVLGHDWYAKGPILHFGWPLVLDLLGLASVVVAGAQGWKLVQTHHVGVKPTHFPVAMRPLEEADDLDELPYNEGLTATSNSDTRPTWH